MALGRWLALALAFSTALLAGDSARADELRPGHVALTEFAPGDWHLVWQAPMRGGITPQTQPILPAGCRIAGRVERAVSGPAMVSRAQVRCAGPVGGARIGLSHFGASATDVLVRVAPLGQPVQALRLTAADPVAAIAETPARGQVAWTYFRIGIDHILFGYDHLLFVIALVLLLDRPRRIVVAVTAFTVAHSVTLIATTLGWVGLPSRPVEAVIALSIIFLAAEIAARRPGTLRLSERRPWVVAFLFGLLHGFGFAGALSEIGLPQGEVPTALLAFNLGVEAGQVAIVAAAIALLAAVRRWAPALTPPVVRAATYSIGVTASFWLIERLFS